MPLYCHLHCPQRCQHPGMPVYSEPGLTGPEPHKTRWDSTLLVTKEERGSFPNIVQLVLISEHPAGAQAWLLCAMTLISFSCQRFPKLNQQPFVCILVQLNLSRNKKSSGPLLFQLSACHFASCICRGNRVANKIVKAGEMVCWHYDEFNCLS